MRREAHCRDMLHDRFMKPIQMPRSTSTPLGEPRVSALGVVKTPFGDRDSVCCEHLVSSNVLRPDNCLGVAPGMPECSYR